MVLEVHAGYAPEGGIRFEVKLKSAVKMGGVEMGMEDITSVTFEGSAMKTVSGKRDID